MSRQMRVVPSAQIKFGGVTHAMVEHGKTPRALCGTSTKLHKFYNERFSSVDGSLDPITCGRCQRELLKRLPGGGLK